MLRDVRAHPFLLAGLGSLLVLGLTALSGCATNGGHGGSSIVTGEISLPLAGDGPTAAITPVVAHNAPVVVQNASTSESEDEAQAWEDEDWEDEEWDEEEDAALIADPLWPYNKLMFHINDNLYYGVLQPVGAAYRFLVPLPLRSGLKNFFTNLAFPVRFINCLLQGKGEAAEREIDRFAMNSVIGVLGFGNPAKQYPELALNEEDFGQTLGVWGAGHGIYIVWPILGPSTLRETLGLVGDIAVAPTTYLLSSRASLALTAGQRVNTLSFHIGDYEALKDSAFDPYSAFRDAYLQLRAAELAK